MPLAVAGRWRITASPATRGGPGDFGQITGHTQGAYPVALLNGGDRTLQPPTFGVGHGTIPDWDGVESMGTMRRAMQRRLWGDFVELMFYYQMRNLVRRGESKTGRWADRFFD